MTCTVITKCLQRLCRLAHTFWLLMLHPKDLRAETCRSCSPWPCHSLRSATMGRDFNWELRMVFPRKNCQARLHHFCMWSPCGHRVGMFPALCKVLRANWCHLVTLETSRKADSKHRSMSGKWTQASIRASMTLSFGCVRWQTSFETSWSSYFLI